MCTRKLNELLTNDLILLMTLQTVDPECVCEGCLLFANIIRYLFLGCDLYEAQTYLSNQILQNPLSFDRQFETALNLSIFSPTLDIVFKFKAI